MILMGNNLGERHRYLNSKVIEAVAEQKSIEELKTRPDESDVDKLFKIDLASKYNDIDYILDVLKCGDVFHVTRALKCAWLYADDYAQYINTDYLGANIFPFMSIKMKRKMLTAISTHVRNANRATQFYEYCTDAKLNDHAAKFLLFTPDNFKLHIIKTKNLSQYRDSKFVEHLIDGSFELAQAYLSARPHSWNRIQELRFLYSVSQQEYLNMLENYLSGYPEHAPALHRLGMRISKNIVNEHKHRVVKEALIYVNILNKNILEKYLTIEDIDSLVPKLLPHTCNKFWNMDFYNTYKFILAKLPTSELFGFLKRIYMSKYNEAEFEMSIRFYELKYYDMLLNVEEREAWALQHIERDKALPNIKNDMWFKFVSYGKAKSAIKHYIFLISDEDERSRIVNILPETVRTREDLIDLLCYYYERHVNEMHRYKASFIDKIIELHDVWSFDSECWTLFDKLLHSLEVYTSSVYISRNYKFRSMVYHIIHDLELPEVLIGLIESANHRSFDDIVETMSVERKVIVAKFLLSFYAQKIKSLFDHPDYNDDKDDEEKCDSIKDKVITQVDYLWDVIHLYKRPHEDCPEFVVKFMESNMDIYENHEKYKKINVKYIKKFTQHTEEDFVRWLKRDTQMAVDGISKIRCNTYRWKFRLNRLFRKLKVYFLNDVGKEYLNYFMGYLSNVPEGRREYRNIKMAVVGVFCLADKESITSFIKKNAPATPKIDHRNIDNRLFQVQKAICRLAYHPRPPLRLCDIQKYIAGDYVKYCIPVIYNYFSNLQANVQFIDSLLDAPLSIQKHGLRLAYRSYDATTLKSILKNAWRKTKNVSLRMLLYQTLFNRMIIETSDIQRDLYEVLKLYTLELNHDDHDYVYSLLKIDYIPNTLKGDFIETAWLAVSKLTDKSIDMKRKISVMSLLETNIDIVRREFLRIQIIDEHVNYMLLEENINRDYDDYYLKELIETKWNVTAKYIVSVNNEVELQESLEILQKILVGYLATRNLETPVKQKLTENFITIIMNKDPQTIDSCESMVSIYQCILDNIRSYLTKEQIYLMNWKLKLTIVARTLINEQSKKNRTPGTLRFYVYCEDIADAYGKHVGEILKSSLKNNEFYRSYYQSIADIIWNVGRTACEIIAGNDTLFICHMCNCLTDIKLEEMHLLAMIMLPKYASYTKYTSEHREAIDKIKNISFSQGVRTFFYRKYVMLDCEESM